MSRSIAATALLAVAALVVACSSPAEPGGGVRFYAEVATAIEPDRDDPLTRIGAETEGGGTIRWWYQAPDRWRWEIETADD